ncbi:MAG: phage BR0599 family protein [Candidatus Didemnitutus sp.]|nr:phage BR0599 family protein [Candidatus Didemnitutus sp.]
MSFPIVNHLGRDLALFLNVPNVREDGSFAITYAFSTTLVSGGSGRENREPHAPDMRLRQSCAYLFATGAEAAAIRAALADLGDTLILVPIWTDVLTGAQWADRIHTGNYLLRLSDNTILAADAVLDPVLEYAPFLVGRFVEQPELKPFSEDAGADASIAIEEDGPWDYRIRINADVAIDTWPATLEPEWTDVIDRSETGREYVQLGAGRERGVENQEVAFKWGQEARFLLSSRDQIRTLLGLFEKAQGRTQSLSMPWWFKPGADDPATPHETKVRFASDKLELTYITGAVASVSIALWQVPWEVDEIAGEEPAQAARAYLYRHTLRVPVGPVVWRHTDYARPITVTEDGVPVTYYPFKIEHDKLSQGYMLDDDPVKLASFVTDSHPWMLILQSRLEAPLAIDIFEHRPEVTGAIPRLRYSGEIADKPTGKGRKLTAPTSVMGGQLDIKVPSFFVQESCQHEFCSNPGCMLNIADYTCEGTITAIADAVVTIAVTSNPIGALPDDLFAGGDAEMGAGLTWQGRDIIRSEDLGGGTQRLTLDRAFRGAVVGTVVTFRRSCSGTWTECDAFGNTDNYGGHPEVGDENISVPQRESNMTGGKK